MHVCGALLAVSPHYTHTSTVAPAKKAVPVSSISLTAKVQAFASQPDDAEEVYHLLWQSKPGEGKGSQSCIASFPAAKWEV